MLEKQFCPTTLTKSNATTSIATGANSNNTNVATLEYFRIAKRPRLRDAHAPLLIKYCNASGQCKREHKTCPCAIGTPARHNTLFGSLGFVIRYLNPLQNTPTTLAGHQLFIAYGVRVMAGRGKTTGRTFLFGVRIQGKNRDLEVALAIHLTSNRKWSQAKNHERVTRICANWPREVAC
jgi:hypothetical protein